MNVKKELAKIKSRNLSYLGICLLFISFLSIVSVFLLSFETFSASLVLLISSFLIVLTLIVLKPKVSPIRLNWMLIGILLLALVMRWGPWLYLEGGQDQGVYIAMSALYEKEGKTTFTDDLAKSLDKQQEHNYERRLNDRVIAQKILDKEASESIFPFYPVHPSLMAVTAEVFGEDNRVFSLTVFSMLSIVGLYLLAKELFNKKVGLLSALLLTLNPLHLYFSKLPVGEIVATAFVLFGLYYFIRYCRQLKKKENSYWNPVLSLLMFTSFFFTRITGLLYLPLFALVLLLVYLFSSEKYLKKGVLVFSSVLYILFAVSQIFYLVFVPTLIPHFYGETSILSMIGIFILIPLILYILIRFLNKPLKFILKSIDQKANLVGIVLLAILVGASIVYGYLAGFTDFYVGTSIDRVWKAVGTGFLVFKDLSLASIVMYLSPFGFILVVWYMFVQKKLDIYQKLLTIFFLFFLAISVFVVTFIPHHFYFARYQLTELLPAGLIIVSYMIYYLFSSKKKILKILGIGFGIIIAAYSIFFSAYQYQGFSGADVTFFNKIKKNIDKDSDLIVYYNPKNWAHSFLVTPLRHYYGYDVFYIDLLEIVEREAMLKLFKEYEHVYFLTNGNDPGLEGFKYLDTFRYAQGFYAATPIPTDFPLKYGVTNNLIPFCSYLLPEKYCGGLIPINYHKGYIDMSLYEIVK